MVEYEPAEPAMSVASRLRERISDAHPVWDTLTKLAAPAAVAISAASYLSGFTYRAMVLNEFGLPINAVEMSVQDTIALGYLSLAALLIGIGTFFLLSGLVGTLLGKAIKKSPPAKANFIKVADFIFKPLAYLNLFNVIVLLMLGGGIAGGVTGLLEANSYKSELNQGCPSRCFYYTTKSGQVRGRIIMYARDRILIASQTATYLVPASDLVSVRPLTPDRKWRIN